MFLGRDFSSGRDYSEEVASKIDREIHKIINEAYEKAIQILTDNIEKLHLVAGYLVRSETMDGEQFKRIMEGEPTYEELDAMVADRKKRSEEENELRRKVIEENERRREEERRAEEERQKKEEERRNRFSNSSGLFDGDPYNKGQKSDNDVSGGNGGDDSDNDDTGEE